MVCYMIKESFKLTNKGRIYTKQTRNGWEGMNKLYRQYTDKTQPVKFTDINMYV